MVSLTLVAFIGLVWLREQIQHGGGPEWLDNELEQPHHHHHHHHVPAAAAAADPPPHPIPGVHDPVDEAHANGLMDLVHNAAVAPVDDDDEMLHDNLPVEPAAPEIDGIDDGAAGDGGDPDGGGGDLLGDDGQWNPMEWDRAAEELTWERLLGLDGSLVFLEHVFWVVSLNTLFVLVFGKIMSDFIIVKGGQLSKICSFHEAFCPYHIGHFIIMGFKLKKYINGAHFEGMLTTLCGYCFIGLSLVVLHFATDLLRFKRSARALGLCYVVVKVALLLVIEILAFPVICGWWLDICSLSLFDANLKVRRRQQHKSLFQACFKGYFKIQCSRTDRPAMTAHRWPRYSSTGS